MTNKLDKFSAISSIICSKPHDLDASICFDSYGRYNPICAKYKKCRIWEKNEEQMDYILNCQVENIFLKACAGSGKTEVVGIRSAYYLKQWDKPTSGIGVLTFTNNAANVIQARVSEFIGNHRVRYPHYIGTFDSWLHRYIANPFAHLITGYVGNDKDRSIRIVDYGSDAGFLYSFRTEYSIEKTGNIKANEYYYDSALKCFVFVSSNKNLDSVRNRLILKDWQKKDLKETKNRFWKAGFATYQDVEFICELLFAKIPVAVEAIASRFPILIIDECQDLGPSQLQILQGVINKNTYLHFVGDLNQSIYMFRHVDPRIIEKFVLDNRFSINLLSHNFRSLQSIVDLCGRLVNQDPIVGQKQPKNLQSCICIFYERSKINTLPDRFIAYLKRNKIDLKQSAILARNNSTVAKLRPGVSGEIPDSMFLALAIRIWNVPTVTNEQISDALTCSGKFLAFRYFSPPYSDRLRFYCPESFESKIEWRIFLSHVLDKCCEHQELSNLDTKWKDWAAIYRKQFYGIFISCIQKAGKGAKILNNKPPIFSAPRNFGEKKVTLTLKTIKDNSQEIRITNFHQVKGETLEAAMVVSSPTSNGEGYWKNWLINPASENARFAYVASSRPRELLIWAVPSPLTTEESLKLQKLGFEITTDI